VREAAARAGSAEARADTEREARAGAEARAKGMEAERDAAREAAAKLRGQLGQIAARAAEASKAAEAAGRREAELEAALGRKAAGDGTCAVCMENARAVVFRPCRHLSCCAECAAGLTECPHCRTPIEDRENIFNL
jgi:hypothetical protein